MFTNYTLEIYRQFSHLNSETSDLDKQRICKNVTLTKHLTSHCCNAFIRFFFPTEKKSNLIKVALHKSRLLIWGVTKSLATASDRGTHYISWYQTYVVTKTVGSTISEVYQAKSDKPLRLPYPPQMNNYNLDQYTSACGNKQTYIYRS